MREDISRLRGLEWHNQVRNNDNLGWGLYESAEQGSRRFGRTQSIKGLEIRGPGQFGVTQVETERFLKQWIHDLALTLLEEKWINPNYEIEYLKMLNNASPIARLHITDAYNRGEAPFGGLGADQLAIRTQFISQNPEEQKRELTRDMLAYVQLLGDNLENARLPGGLPLERYNDGDRHPFIPAGAGVRPNANYFGFRGGAYTAAEFVIRMPERVNMGDVPWQLESTNRQVVDSVNQMGIYDNRLQNELGVYPGQRGANNIERELVRTRQAAWVALNAISESAEKPDINRPLAALVETALRKNMEAHANPRDPLFIGLEGTPVPLPLPGTIVRRANEGGPALVESLAGKIVSNALTNPNVQGSIAEGNVIENAETLTANFLEQLPLGPFFEDLYNPVFNSQQPDTERSGLNFFYAKTPGDHGGYFYLAHLPGSMTAHFDIDQFGVASNDQHNQDLIDWMRDRVELREGERPKLPLDYHNYFRDVLTMIDLARGNIKVDLNGQPTTAENGLNAEEFSSLELADMNKFADQFENKKGLGYAQMPNPAGLQQDLLLLGGDEESRVKFSRMQVARAAFMMAQMAMDHYNNEIAWANAAREKGMPILEDEVDENGNVTQQSLKSFLQVLTTLRQPLSDFYGRQLNISENTRSDIGILFSVVESLQAQGYSEANMALIVTIATELKDNDEVKAYIQAVLKEQYPDLDLSTLPLEADLSQGGEVQRQQLDVMATIQGILLSKAADVASNLSVEDFEKAQNEAKNDQGQRDILKEADILSPIAIKASLSFINAEADYLSVPENYKALMTEVIAEVNALERNRPNPELLPDTSQFADLTSVQQGRFSAKLKAIIKNSAGLETTEERLTQSAVDRGFETQKSQLFIALLDIENPVTVTLPDLETGEEKTQSAMTWAMEFAVKLYPQVFGDSIPLESINLEDYIQSERIQKLVNNIIYLSYDPKKGVEANQEMLNRSFYLASRILKESTADTERTISEEALLSAFRGQTSTDPSYWSKITPTTPEFANRFRVFKENILFNPDAIIRTLSQWVKKVEALDAEVQEQETAPAPAIPDADASEARVSVNLNFDDTNMKQTALISILRPTAIPGTTNEAIIDELKRALQNYVSTSYIANGQISTTNPLTLPSRLATPRDINDRPWIINFTYVDEKTLNFAVRNDNYSKSQVLLTGQANFESSSESRLVITDFLKKMAEQQQDATVIIQWNGDSLDEGILIEATQTIGDIALETGIYEEAEFEASDTYESAILTVRIPAGDSRNFTMFLTDVNDVVSDTYNIKPSDMPQIQYSSDNSETDNVLTLTFNSETRLVMDIKKTNPSELLRILKSDDPRILQSFQIKAKAHIRSTALVKEEDNVPIYAGRYDKQRIDNIPGWWIQTIVSEGVEGTGAASFEIGHEDSSDVEPLIQGIFRMPPMSEAPTSESRSIPNSFTASNEAIEAWITYRKEVSGVENPGFEAFFNESAQFLSDLFANRPNEQFNFNAFISDPQDYEVRFRKQEGQGVIAITTNETEGVGGILRRAARQGITSLSNIYDMEFVPRVARWGGELSEPSLLEDAKRLDSWDNYFKNLGADTKSGAGVTFNLNLKDSTGKVYVKSVSLPLLKLNNETLNIAFYLASFINIYGVINGVTEISLESEGLDSSATIGTFELLEATQGYFTQQFGRSERTASFGEGINWNFNDTSLIDTSEDVEDTEAVEVDYSKGKAIAFDVGGTNLKSIAMDSGAEKKFDNANLATIQSIQGDEFRLGNLIQDRIEEYSDLLGITPSPQNPIVIAVPGPVDDEGRIVDLTNIPQHAESLLELQESYPPGTILFQNDANTAILDAIAELGLKGNIIGNTLGTGLGLAIALDGKVLTGPMEAHVRAFFDDSDVLHENFGMRGNLESFANADFVVRRASELIQERGLQVEGEITSMRVGEWLGSPKIDEREIAQQTFQEMGSNMTILYKKIAEIYGETDWTLLHVGGIAQSPTIEHIQNGINGSLAGSGLSITFAAYPDAPKAGAIGAANFSLVAQQTQTDSEARLTEEQLKIVDQAVATFNLTSLNRLYLIEMWKQDLYPDPDKQPLKAVGDRNNPNFDEGENFLYNIQLTPGENEILMGVFEWVKFKDNPNYAAAAKDVHVTVYALDGGLGESLGRWEFKEALVGLGLLKESDIERDANGKIKIGAKGTDLGFIVTINGKEIFVSIAEAKMLQLLHLAQLGTFGGLGIRPLVNDDSLPSYERLLDSAVLEDRLDDSIPDQQKRKYRDVLQEANIEVVTPFMQQVIPGVTEDLQGLAVNPNGLAQPGGHGQLGFSFFAFPENWRPRKDGKKSVLYFANGDNLNASNVDKAIIGRLVVENNGIGKLVTPATRIDVKGGKEGVKMVRAPDGSLIYIPQQQEIADAKSAGEKSLDLFLSAGQPDGKEQYGEESVGKQLFNTNVIPILEDVIMPLLAELKAHVGDEDYYEIISPTRIKKPIKTAKDGNRYMPVDGAIGTVIHNINEYFMLSEDQAVHAMLDKAGVTKGPSGRYRVLSLFNVPRQFFTPNKFPFDPYMQANRSVMRLNTDTFLLEPVVEGWTPPEANFEGADPNDNYYSELQNLRLSLGLKPDLSKLTGLDISGRVKLENATLIGEVEIVNSTGELIDLRGDEYDQQLREAGIKVGDDLVLNNIGLIFFEDRTLGIIPYAESREINQLEADDARGVRRSDESTNNISDTSESRSVDEFTAIQAKLETLAKEAYEANLAGVDFKEIESTHKQKAYDLLNQVKALEDITVGVPITSHHNLKPGDVVRHLPMFPPIRYPSEASPEYYVVVGPERGTEVGFVLLEGGYTDRTYEGRLIRVDREAIPRIYSKIVPSPEKILLHDIKDFAQFVAREGATFEEVTDNIREYGQIYYGSDFNNIVAGYGEKDGGWKLIQEEYGPLTNNNVPIYTTMEKLLERPGSWRRSEIENPENLKVGDVLTSFDITGMSGDGYTDYGKVWVYLGLDTSSNWRVAMVLNNQGSLQAIAESSLSQDSYKTGFDKFAFTVNDAQYHDTSLNAPNNGIVYRPNNFLGDNSEARRIFKLNPEDISGVWDMDSATLILEFADESVVLSANDKLGENVEDLTQALKAFFDIDFITIKRQEDSDNEITISYPDKRFPGADYFVIRKLTSYQQIVNDLQNAIKFGVDSSENRRHIISKIGATNQNGLVRTIQKITERLIVRPEGNDLAKDMAGGFTTLDVNGTPHVFGVTYNDGIESSHTPRTPEETLQHVLDQQKLGTELTNEDLFVISLESQQFEGRTPSVELVIRRIDRESIEDERTLDQFRVVTFSPKSDLRIGVESDGRRYINFFKRNKMHFNTVERLREFLRFAFNVREVDDNKIEIYVGKYSAEAFFDNNASIQKAIHILIQAVREDDPTGELGALERTSGDAIVDMMNKRDEAEGFSGDSYLSEARAEPGDQIYFSGTNSTFLVLDKTELGAGYYLPDENVLLAPLERKKDGTLETSPKLGNDGKPTNTIQIERSKIGPGKTAYVIPRDETTLADDTASLPTSELVSSDVLSEGRRGNTTVTSEDELHGYLPTVVSAIVTPSDVNTANVSTTSTQNELAEYMMTYDSDVPSLSDESIAIAGQTNTMPTINAVSQDLNISQEEAFFAVAHAILARDGLIDDNFSQQIKEVIKQFFGNTFDLEDTGRDKVRFALEVNVADLTGQKLQDNLFLIGAISMFFPNDTFEIIAMDDQGQPSDQISSTDLRNEYSDVLQKLYLRSPEQASALASRVSVVTVAEEDIRNHVLKGASGINRNTQTVVISSDRKLLDGFTYGKFDILPAAIKDVRIVMDAVFMKATALRQDEVEQLSIYELEERMKELFPDYQTRIMQMFAAIKKISAAA